jgi:hypothetical protein
MRQEVLGYSSRRYMAAVLEVGMCHDSESMTYTFFNITVLQPSTMKEKTL